MAITEIYVDPSIAGDSGAGTIGDPYGDLEYAIEQETFDTTNGTRINVKAGTDEVLAAKLETALADTGTSVAWVPSATAPLIIQGYTSTAGDGGIGGISGGGSVGIFGDDSVDYVHLIDLHLHSTGANAVVALDNFCSVQRCEVNNSTGNGVQVDNYSVVDSCYIHNVDQGVNVSTGTVVSYCFFANMLNVPLVIAGSGTTAYRNIVSVSGGVGGILGGAGVSIISNSIYSAGGSSYGISITGSVTTCIIENNLIEGFSGSGGQGMDIDAAGQAAFVLRGNAVYNCESAYDFSTINAELATISGGDNETLSASPFVDAPNGDFSPVDTGNVKEGSVPAVVGGGLV